LQGSLFFINSGKVKLYFDDQGSEVIINTMGRGQIFGEGVFFEASSWTISVAAIGTADISILKLDALQEWAESFPGLEEKLHTFCKRFEKIEDFIKRSSNDRRTYKRYRIAGRVATTLLDNRSRGIGTGFMAELFDISEGGISFLTQIPPNENARLLLGRKIQLKVPLRVESGEGLVLVGDVLAAKDNHGAANEYSLHMKFDNLLDQKQLHDIVTALHEESQVTK
jgi:hypothetical protein